MIMTLQIIEPVIIPDIYVCGFMRPESLGNGDWRYTGYTKQDLFDGHGAQCVINSRLIIPSAVVMLTIKETMQAFGVACCGAERLRLLNH
jgi:hypothetical protein